MLPVPNADESGDTEQDDAHHQKRKGNGILSCSHQNGVRKLEESPGLSLDYERLGFCIVYLAAHDRQEAFVQVDEDSP